MGNKAKTKLDSPTVRRRLKARAKPYCLSLAPRRLLGYVRAATGLGRWLAIVEIGRSDSGAALRRQGPLGLADDFAESDGIGVLSYAEACKAAASWEPGGVSGALSVAQAVENYVEHRKTEKGAKSGMHARRMFKLHVLPVFGRRAVSALTQIELEAWKAKLVESGHKRSGVNRLCADFRAMLNHAAQRADLNDKAWRKGLKPLDKAHDPRPLHFSEAEIGQLLTAAYGLDAATGAYFEACYRLGARMPSEIAHLHVRDFRPAEHTLYIHSGKTGRRHVVLNSESVKFFQSVVKRRNPDELLLPRADGNAWDASSQRLAFKEVLKAAGLTSKATPYCLRHSHVSRALERNMPLAVLAENLGTSVQMLMRFYGHLMTEAKRRAVEESGPRVGLRLVASNRGPA